MKPSVGTGMAMEVEPAADGEVESNTRLGLLLVNVTTVPAGAGAPSVKMSWTCRNFPMEIVPVARMPIPGTPTLAPMLPNAAGAVNPDGTSTEIVELPEAPAGPGWKKVVTPAEPAGIVTGEVVIVPALVFELVTFTPPGGPLVMGPTPGTPTKSLDESSLADSTVSGVGPEPLATEKVFP